MSLLYNSNSFSWIASRTVYRRHRYEMLLAKILVAVIAVCLGALSQLDSDEEVLITSKKVVLTTSRAKLFQFLADMRNFKRVNTDPSVHFRSRLGRLSVINKQFS